MGCFKIISRSVPYVVGLVLVSILVLIYSSSILIIGAVILLNMYVLYSFRDINREIVAINSEDAILSPVDGFVKSIEQSIEHDIEHDSYLDNAKDIVYKIVIQTRFKDAGVFLAPMNCDVLKCEVNKGINLGSKHSAFSLLNSNLKAVFKKDDCSVLAKHVSSFGDAFSYISAKNSLKKGDKYGFYFKGKSYIFISSKARICVKEGDFLKSGSSLLGYFYKEKQLEK